MAGRVARALERWAARHAALTAEHVHSRLAADLESLGEAVREGLEAAGTLHEEANENIRQARIVEERVRRAIKAVVAPPAEVAEEAHHANGTEDEQVRLPFESPAPPRPQPETRAPWEPR